MRLVKDQFTCSRQKCRGRVCHPIECILPKNFPDRKKGFENKYFSSLIMFLRGSKSCNSAFSGAYANFGISESQARLPWLVQ